MARQHQVHVLCLPELCITGYGCEDMFLAPACLADGVGHAGEKLPLKLKA
ncbi:MAG: hypothetical protein U0936_24085 [Planctomycetaceae bacterium]